jgi:hypothetical protein
MDEPKEGYYGGAVAGPVFKQIAARAAGYLNIRPDIGGPGFQETMAQNNDKAPKIISGAQ